MVYIWKYTAVEGWDHEPSSLLPPQHRRNSKYDDASTSLLPVVVEEVQYN